MMRDRDKERILQKTREYIRNSFEGENSGHDWWHIHRVCKMALHIARIEGGNLFIIEMAALLHDLDDWKFNDSEELIKTRTFLMDTDIEHNEIETIEQIIREVSFKGAGVKNEVTTLEARIVQDADRLDAMGALGIARTFAYGGAKGRVIYDPYIKPNLHKDFDSYKKDSGPTINHFYEKLLLLKDRLNTTTAKQIGESRHRFMEDFIARFYTEWDAKN